jgi:23S rRNA pseudouridine1911/1915/1917 synthase
VQLGLDHPVSRERLVFEAPLPESFARLLRVLRGSASLSP